MDLFIAYFLTQMTDILTSNDNILDLNTDLKTHPGISNHIAVTDNVNLTVERQK